jgi:titin
LNTDTDYLYVADTTNDRIVVIDVDGNCDSGDDEYFAEDICFVAEFETSDDSGVLNDPSGLALNTDTDYLYVADTTNDRIVVIDVDGNCDSGDDEYFAEDICFVEEIGSFGDDDDELDEPSYLVRNSDEDLVYVSDTGNDRIQIIEISGSSSSTDAPSRPTGLEAYPISKTSIFITWDVGDPDEDITGYKIEAREGTDDYEVLVSNTGSNANSFVHGGLSSSETYTYRIYAINAQGTSSVSSTSSEKPEDSNAPAALTATAISDSQIKLNWFPPTNTFGQSISGYIIEREITEGVYDEVADVGSQTTTYTVSNLQTDKTYSYVVRAEFSQGGSPRSNPASATPSEDSFEPTSSSITTPSSPNLTAKAVSENEVSLSWSKPSDGGSSITGYKIEVKENSGSYSILVENTKNDSTTYSHTNLTPNTQYTYKVSAINGIGVGSSSNESSATPTDAPEPTLEIKPLGRLSIDEGKRLAFVVGITDNSLNDVRFSLANNAPSGASISSSSGSFNWTPSKSQSGTYTFDVIAKTSSLEDRESITITVNDVPDTEPQPPDDEPKDEPKEPQEPKDLGIASFVDPTKDPQSYVDRYNNEPNYKEWFDENYPEYDSIYQAVGLEEPKGIAVFVDPTKDPQSYVDRYNNEPNYKEWFDENFPEYDSIYEAVGLEEPKMEEPKIGKCGEGTKLVDGVCTPVKQPKEGGGCLIATAAYGSEMAPQVQFLREIRDDKVMNTESGASFMSGFNEFYYSFSPAIADYERENPAFKEAVKLGLTPMLTSLSLLSGVDIDSEQEMLGYGIAIILANVGMYFAAPAILVYGIKKSRLVRF